MIERRCEVLVLDGEDRDVPCGRVGVERVHDGWVCNDCRVEVDPIEVAQPVEFRACRPRAA